MLVVSIIKWPWLYFPYNFLSILNSILAVVPVRKPFLVSFNRYYEILELSYGPSLSRFNSTTRKARELVELSLETPEQSLKTGSDSVGLKKFKYLFLEEKVKIGWLTSKASMPNLVWPTWLNHYPNVGSNIVFRCIIFVFRITLWKLTWIKIGEKDTFKHLCLQSN